MRRVVSLLASATETVWALGRGSWLVGRSHECDHPPAVADLPPVSEPRFEVGLPSGEVDRSVKRLLGEALGVYRVDPDRLRQLEPDVILTQTQCEVCAVTPGDLDRALREWMPARPPEIVELEPVALADVRRDMRIIADALDAAETGRRLVEDIRIRMDALSERARRADDRPRVAYIEWVEPLMAAGNWMPELVELAGGEALFVGPGEHSPSLDWTVVRDADPDVLFVSPCGYDLERTREDLELLRTLDGWAELRAVREGRVYYADANAFLTRPGPRIADGLRILCEVLHPDVFPPTLRGVGWERVESREDP